MFNLIAIIEKSKIVREGLEMLLRTHSVAAQVICMESFDEWQDTVSKTIPDIVIVNPELVREGIEKIRAKYHLGAGTFFVAIVYLYYSYKEITEVFDEAIFITDPEEIILNKFQVLFNQGNKNTDEKTGQLTLREKDVLKLLLQGLSNKEVADKLTISTHTVITHRKNIIEKTGIRSLSGLAVYAIINNIADMDDLKK